MKRRALLTVLDDNPGLARQLGNELAKSGFDVSAHIWEDSLKDMAWAPAGRELASDACQAWVIAGPVQAFSTPSVRKGLSLAALCGQSVHGTEFPILVSPAAGSVDPALLPTPLAGAQCVPKGLGPKTAIACAKARRSFPEYRLDLHPMDKLGLWLEAGPRRDPWKGAFAGGLGAFPSAHGVGPSGTVPASCTLHYQVQGMKFTLDGAECEAWGVHNELAPGISYYARFTEAPDAVVFGPFPDEDEAEPWVIRLC